MRMPAPTFDKLPKEKRTAILTAAMEVFGGSDYRHASTDMIAVKAGISKGLLFYYFHNKKELYLRCYDFVYELVYAALDEKRLAAITDFFDLMSYGARVKLQMVKDYPYILDFSVRAFYSNGEEVSEDAQKHTAVMTGEQLGTYLVNLDYSRFRPEIDPAYMMQMLVWMTDGYLHQKMLAGGKLDIDDVMKNFNYWAKQFKRLAYKEETDEEGH